MTRAPRAAALPVQCVWITDDILAEAFNRFAQVSCTRTCRRYGSNVPGPLEAHRRLARRRMGLAAVAASSGPPLQDIGALFGFGAKAPLPLEKSWKWEAPSLQTPSLGAGPPPPPSAASVRPWSPPQSKSRRLDETAQVEERHVKPAISMHPVKASCIAFRNLLASLETDSLVDEGRMARLVDFLQSSADEPRAANTLALARWLLPREISPEALQLLARGVYDKVKLLTLSQSQLIPILALLVQRAVNADIEACLTLILQAVPESGRHSAVSKVSRYLRSATEAELDAVRLWFRVLDGCSPLQGSHYDDQTWRYVYQQFARHVKPSALAEHFAQLDHVDFAQVLLRYWVPHLTDEETEPSAVDCRGHKALNFRHAKVQEASVQELIDDFEALRESNAISNSDIARKATDFTIVDLAAVLARHHRPYAQVLHEAFAILKQTKHPLAVWGVFHALNFHPKVGVPQQLAVDILHYFLETGDSRDLRWAWRIFKNVPSVSVRECIDLPLKLIEHGYGTPDRIFFILLRKTGEDITLPELRDTARLSLTPEHIDLVHLTAYAWATQSTRSRVAFRRVWETYRFLQDRGAPLSVLMSRALVKAGILRPLEEGKYVPLAQTRYIISLVQRLEGDDIAQNLDRLVFVARKNNRVPRDGSGIWVGRMDEGIVRATRWRLRLWSKKQSSPWSGGEGISRSRFGDGHVSDGRQQASGPSHEHRARGSSGPSAAKGPFVIFDPLAAPRDTAPDSADQSALRHMIDRETRDEGVADGGLTQEVQDAFESDEQPVLLDAQQYGLHVGRSRPADVDDL